MKYYIKQSVIILTILLNAGSCSNPTQSNKIKNSKIKAVVQSRFAKIYPDFNPEYFREQLRAGVENDSILYPYYSNSKSAPIWTNDTLNTSRLSAFLDIISRVEEHGLDTNIFDKDLIQSLTDSIDSGLFANKIDTLYLKMTELEKLSTKSLFKYATGMQYGFTDPRKIYKTDHDIDIAYPDSAYYTKLYDDVRTDPIATLLESEPQNRVYKKMQEEYKNLENKKNIEWKNINDIGTNIYKIGASNSNITAITNRLIATGEYEVDSTFNNEPHTVLDKKLMDAVNAFRKKISYPEETEIGSLTIEALNRPITYYQEKIKANMERYRWKHNKQKHNKHIEVNIPAFKLFATQKEDSIPLIMRVCVGTIRNKTPLIESDISYINLNPTWNVPKSIVQGEISVLQKKDRTYMSKRNMKLFKNGKEVAPETINWSKVVPSKFNYTVRQEPGNNNSLGRMKFMFRNNFAVYLHDTPVKRAFLRKNRAVSHGCIRVQQPIDLAFFCLSPTSDIYKDQLRYSIEKEPETKEGKDLMIKDKLKKLANIINPKDKISLTIDYLTVYMHPDEDNLYYADDVYEYDSILLEKISL